MYKYVYIKIINEKETVILKRTRRYIQKGLEGEKQK